MEHLSAIKNELHSVLLTYESRMEHLSAIKNGVGSINLDTSSANIAQNFSSNPRGGRASYGSCGNYARGRGRGRNYGRNFYQNSNNNNNNSIKRPCQICGMTNHQAATCRNRYDSRYMGSRPNQMQGTPVSAYIATPKTVTDSAWYADIGATHHVLDSKDGLEDAVEHGGQSNKEDNAARRAK